MSDEKLSDVIEGFGEDPRPVLTVAQMLEAFDSRAFGATLLVFGLLNCLPLPPGKVIGRQIGGYGDADAGQGARTSSVVT